MHKLVMYDEFWPLRFLLRCFHCIDELWYSAGVAEERFRYFGNIYSINCVKPWTKFGEMVKEFEGRDVWIERIWVLEFLLPCIVDDFHDEVLAGRICCFVERAIISPGFIFSFSSVNFCSRCVLVNCVTVECNDCWYWIRALRLYMLVTFRWKNVPGEVVC